MTQHRQLIASLIALMGLALPLSAVSIEDKTPNVDQQTIEQRTIIQLAKAGSQDDGKATPNGQAKAAQKALKKSKGKVLKVQRGQAGYTVKVLTASGKVQQIWIAD
ncbi:hypothetical protein [uncultured Pseudoteredinibacter sp.]|uniref:hypothetical protein n=1 Tax=uncultured Pseudoteredinibacter sp. TaxID=1641701 RepID=UPI00262AA827|nr:hypothetical protein [uncultured Pseudoteredinibacter sp.]